MLGLILQFMVRSEEHAQEGDGKSQVCDTFTVCMCVLEGEGELLT